ncbi:MAG: porin [Kiloniellaceae bacterium]
MRKELFLGTTALLAGAVAMPDYVSAEEPLRLQVRGYKNEFFGVGDVDDDTNPGFGNTGEFNDGEVHFKGDTDLDNGLTIGVDIQLEAFQSGDQIDEAYTWIDGDFGRVVIGSENLADYTSFWGATAPSVGIPINSGWITVFVPQPAGSGLSFRSPGLTTNVTLTNDTFQISYLSPRFAGFQFTGGYAPTDASSGNAKNAITDTDVENHDIFGVGVNWGDSFNGVDLGFAAGYERASVADNVDALGGDDPQLFKVGASLGFAGFTVAGSYANEFDGRNNATRTVSEEGQSFDVGASYATGPWGVSATYFHGEEEDLLADPDDDEVDAFVGAVSYALGPGITTSLSVIHGKYDNEDGIESEATMGVIGLAVKF